MSIEELLIFGATVLEASQKVCAHAHSLQTLIERNIAHAWVFRQQRQAISGGSDQAKDEPRTRIRALLDTLGVLRQRGVKLRVGRSPGGYPCVACRQDLPFGEIEYEIVIGNVVTVLMHRHCYEIWTSEVGGEL